MPHSQDDSPSIRFARSISTIAAKDEDMFAKLKESELFKSLAEAFCCSAKKSAAAGSGGTRKTEEAMGSNKPESEITIS